MRAYYLPLSAGVVLVGSAFFPWVMLGEVSFGGVPSFSAIWILVLGLVTILLAVLSLITRKNSRHPLLLVGLLALGIQFLSWQWLEHSVSEQAWATAEAAAIVEGHDAVRPAPTRFGIGIYLGLVASIVIVGFGLTIVFKQAAVSYIPPDDDV